MKTFNLKIIEYEKTPDAFAALVSGAWYFLRKKTLLTLLVSSPIIGGGIWHEVSDFTGYKIEVKRAEPIAVVDTTKDGSFYFAPLLADSLDREIRFDFGLMPEARAEELQKGEPILINGKLYGYADTDYSVWKIMGQNRLLIYHKPDALTFYVEADMEEIQKQFKK